MTTKFSSKVSIKALSVTLLLFVIANCISYIRMQPGMMDGYAECGFPFSFYGQGGIVNVSEIFWMGLVFDFIIAFLAGTVVGRIWQRIERL